MDAWRTSCPRLPVWEDASERGLWRRSLRVAAPSFEQHEQAWLSSRRRDRMLTRSYNVQAVLERPNTASSRPAAKSRGGRLMPDR